MDTTARSTRILRILSRLGLTLAVLAGLLAMPVPAVNAASCPPTFVVKSNADDSGPNTLRKAIDDLCTGGTITFDRSLSDKTITLASVLTINKTMTIDGSSLTKQITISGGNSTQIFNITGSGTLALKSLKITNGRGSDGGGIFNRGTLTITNSTVADNTAPAGHGGGIYNDGSLTAINCTFSGNSAAGGTSLGGAIRNDGTLVVKNCTFSGNSAPAGSGIGNNTGSTLTLVNSSVFGNSSGVAIYNWGSMTITNTILAGTIGANDCFNTTSGTTSSASKNNLIQTDAAGANKCAETGDTSYILGSDPKLSALADNGGPTQTLELQVGSPAIDAGDYYGTCLSVEGGKDQRSVSRKDASDKCDIGAFEDGPYLTPSVITINPGPGVTLTTSTSTLSVIFNKDVDPDSAVKTDNYLLVSPGADSLYQTNYCVTGLAGDDKKITISSVSYDSPTFTSTLTVNGGKPLANSDYRLLICGTTSIIDTVTTKLNNGADDSFSFSVNAPVVLTGGTGSGSRNRADIQLPATGFAPGRVTSLPARSSDYSGLNLSLEIPAIRVNAPIVGVPQNKGGWDVDWLGHDAGWLNGSAFPTWVGNSVITGHVWDADNHPGLFADLKTLKYGDTVLIRAFGEVYTYEVRDSRLVGPDGINRAIDHEDQPWVTLVTCEDFDSATGDYIHRRLVSAVLVDVTAEN